MKSHILGFPSIGEKRELKKALESFWKKEISFQDLENKAEGIKIFNWELQKSSGLTYVTTGDFSLYDNILDTTSMLGLVPSRFGFKRENIYPKYYFDMARGNQKKNILPLEMKKWFNTNYHYMVPEFEKNLRPLKSSQKIISETRLCSQLGYNPKPVLTGAFTYLLSGNEIKGFERFELLDEILNIYCEIVKELSNYTDLIQIDEPILSTDIDVNIKKDFKCFYKKLKKASGNSKIMIASYFDELRENLDLIFDCGIDGIHFDFVNQNKDLEKLSSDLPENMFLSLGIINGKNVWINNLENSIEILSGFKKRFKNEIMVSTSCSLKHVPVNLENETLMDENIKSLFSFAKQKIIETSFLGRALDGNIDNTFLEKNKKAFEFKKSSKKLNIERVRTRVKNITDQMFERKSPFEKRIKIQKEKLNLPIFPVTTIGSFPQTPDIRKQRQKFKKGDISKSEYNNFIESKIDEMIDFQEKTGLDVFVHGEPERNDMVEYFGENLEGFIISQNGWVQSYGSRCVKPPVIYGDIERLSPVTLNWINYASSKTDKIVKGMLTGPVTIYCWSFPRDDISKKEILFQLGLAIRDEVCDLEKSGIKIIQIDEAALREGLPLRKSKHEDYLETAVNSFCLASSGVGDETQIHTHMCYSEFNSIIEWIAKMDADVITIEASRSKMKLLDAFKKFNYPNEAGPGVYDIHSPRIPETEEIVNLLKLALETVPANKLWVNPDCGLKTRGWDETEKSLKNLVKAAQILRKEYENIII
ncbi:MAG: 5-methyltetrahydropteroyltriglutamate--homocysteine S-methyltransferase [Desulforegulaceae bacterium]|nr:5-methyltetrahydropteroyltriglutamate--homocysteine S-methyltransferase [Desulforegulaceae bacterium]